MGHTDNEVVIAAPLEYVWQLTNDVEQWPRLFTEYSAAEVLERRGDTVRFRLTMHPDENGDVWSWVSERTPDPATRTVEAVRIETGPFEFMRLHWDYAEVDGGVRLRWRQDFAMKPTIPVDDAEATRRLNVQTRHELDHIKEVVEAGATVDADSAPGPGGGAAR